MLWRKSFVCMMPLLALVLINRQSKTLSGLTLSNQLHVTSITTTTTMIIATYPSTEVRLNAIYSHLNCLSEGVDRIIVSAPDWSHDVMSNFSMNIQSRLSHDIYKKITFQYYINDRYDAGLWCDALDDEMGGRNTTTSTLIIMMRRDNDKQLIIFLSMIVSWPFDHLLDYWII